MIKNKISKILCMLLVAIFVATTLTSCASTNETTETKETVKYTYNKDKIVNVGIAWITDGEDRSEIAVKNAVEELGEKASLLPEVKDYDLEYDKSEISSFLINENGELSKESAEKVKTNSYKNSNIEEVMKGIDVVVLPGGDDICTTLYKDNVDFEQHDKEDKHSPARDVSDYLITKYCLDNDIPILGICRGMQMIAIVSGCKIMQDIPSYLESLGKNDLYVHREKRNSEGKIGDFIPHDVSVLSKDSLIYKTYGNELIKNAPSWHHQAVESVDGTDLKVTAISSVGGVDIIEAVESITVRFALGVQFHPEFAYQYHKDDEPTAYKFMDVPEALTFFSSLIDAGKYTKEIVK